MCTLKRMRRPVFASFLVAALVVACGGMSTSEGLFITCPRAAPRVACGGATCARDTPVCCPNGVVIGGSVSRPFVCAASSDECVLFTSLSYVTCDDSADCPGGSDCCSFWTKGGSWHTCASSCAVGTKLCTQRCDCQGGDCVDGLCRPEP